MKKLNFLILALLFFANCFATDTITPKPITLTFFELTNTLTAQHKKQLDKVAGFLKKNKEMQLLIIAGANTKKAAFIANFRIENINKYLNFKNVNDTIIKTYLSGNVVNYTIEISFIKDIEDSVRLLDLDSIRIVSFNFKGINCGLSFQKKIDLKNISQYVLKNNLQINIRGGSSELIYSRARSNCRINAIKNFLKFVCNVNEKQITFEFSDDLNEDFVEINI